MHFKTDNNITVQLQWVEAFENSHVADVSYHINVTPSINDDSITINGTSANVTVSYNTQYNVSVVANLCEVTKAASRIIELNYGGYIYINRNSVCKFA